MNGNKREGYTMKTKREYVLTMDGEERMTFRAVSDEAAKRQARRYLAGCACGSERIEATVCRPCGGSGQWLDEVATVTAKPRRAGA